MIRPIFEYPIIPLCISSKTNIKKMQQFQNKILRAATRENEEDRELPIEELHQRYRIEAINTRLYRLASKVWQNLILNNEELANMSQEENNNVATQDHFWWRRISPYIDSGEPQPDFATE